MKTQRRILPIVLIIATLLLLVLDIPVEAAGTKKVDVCLPMIHIPIWTAFNNCGWTAKRSWRFCENKNPDG